MRRLPLLAVAVFAILLWLVLYPNILVLLDSIRDAEG